MAQTQTQAYVNVRHTITQRDSATKKDALFVQYDWRTSVSLKDGRTEKDVLTIALANALKNYNMKDESPVEKCKVGDIPGRRFVKGHMTVTIVLEQLNKAVAQAQCDKCGGRYGHHPLCANYVSADSVEATEV